MNILLLGSGGREHAFAWKISKSNLCSQLYVAPGNAGTDLIAININLNINDFEEVKKLALDKKISLVVVGPEEPLVRGIVDYFKDDNELKNIKIFGPTKTGSQLEGSKDFSKNFMFRNGIPCAKSKTFNKDSIDEGFIFLEKMNAPYVLKADGLAAGKGVIISNNLKEAKDNLKNMLLNEQFGDASKNVLIEEFLDGIEVSVFAITDGKNYILLPEAKDYKKIGENDSGLNTGGMGAVSPVNFASNNFMQLVENTILKPTVNGLNKENIDFKGFIFAGLMNVNGKPYVIEYNVRMGDPETQVVIPRIKNDFVDIILKCIDNNINQVQLEIENNFVSTVILASNGYPENYSKGDTISNLSPKDDCIIFHAGTKKYENKIITNGGRVIACTGIGEDLITALNNSYKLAKIISWENKYYRNDIGKDLMNNK
jgi:phosphoribosylamine--glycine ligase|tara:strand:+ start:120 stop:1403 length:1284 start_codon:yes stop_codon:yes gene_type:complete